MHLIKAIDRNGAALVASGPHWTIDLRTVAIKKRSGSPRSREVFDLRIPFPPRLTRMLRAVIVDFEATPRLGKQRLFLVSGPLACDDHSVLPLISDWLTHRSTPPSIVDFGGLELCQGSSETESFADEHHAANTIVVHLAQIAVRRPNRLVFRRWNAVMASRLNELFAVWDLPRPIFF